MMVGTLFLVQKGQTPQYKGHSKSLGIWWWEHCLQYKKVNPPTQYAVHIKNIGMWWWGQCP